MLDALVIGTTGSQGGAVARRLLDGGHQVRGPAIPSRRPRSRSEMDGDVATTMTLVTQPQDMWLRKRAA